MRTLNFIVNSQHIIPDPECDFTNIVAGSSGYLRAHFKFSSDWRGYAKVARFQRGEKEEGKLLVDNACDIPPEILTGATFKVSVIGQKGPARIETNRIIVQQEVSR